MLALRMDVMLPVRECEGRMVDIELEVAEEIVERGRGMNSSLSENPTTLDRGIAAGGCDSLGFSTARDRESMGRGSVG